MLPPVLRAAAITFNLSGDLDAVLRAPCIDDPRIASTLRECVTCDRHLVVVSLQETSIGALRSTHLSAHLEACMRVAGFEPVVAVVSGTVGFAHATRLYVYARDASAVRATRVVRVRHAFSRRSCGARLEVDVGGRTCVLGVVGTHTDSRRSAECIAAVRRELGVADVATVVVGHMGAPLAARMEGHDDAELAIRYVEELQHARVYWAPAAWSGLPMPAAYAFEIASTRADKNACNNSARRQVAANVTQLSANARNGAKLWSLRARVCALTDEAAALAEQAQEMLRQGEEAQNASYVQGAKSVIDQAVERLDEARELRAQHDLATATNSAARALRSIDKCIEAARSRLRC